MKVTSCSPEDTEELGFQLGSKLKAGDIVRLYGELGAGKTTFVKGIARAFGIARKDITSASFTIIAEYPSDPPFFHIDLYRMMNAQDLESTGIWDCLGPGAIAVVEWAEHAEDQWPERSLKVFINSLDEDRREIIIEGYD